MVRIYLSSEIGLSGIHTICIGLGLYVKDMGLKLGYMKPLGYRYYREGDRATDEDVAFMRNTLGLEEDLDDLCPVLLTPKLAREGLTGGPNGYLEKVRRSFERVSRQKDVVLLQGAFTSRQGWFLGLSAYQLARALDARVLLVERFDDALLADNVLACRDQYGDNLMGVIYNIVPPVRSSFVDEFIAPRLEEEGIPILGNVPFDHVLRSIEVGELARMIDGKVLSGEANLGNSVEEVLVGAMGHEYAINVFRKHRNICVVTGGDRSDIQLAAMRANARCLILSGNLYPSNAVLSKAEEQGLPIVLVEGDTFSTAERVEAIIRSARTHGEKKVKRVERLIDSHVDLERLFSLAGL